MRINENIINIKQTTMIKKLQFKSWLLVLLMMLGVTNVWASTYTYDFSTGGVHNETSSPKTSLWTTAYFTILQEQNSSTSPVANYLTAPRWYKNHTITITPVDGCQISQIQINCNNPSYTGQDISASTGSITKSGNNSIWTGEITNSSALVLTMGTQCRPTSLVVTYESSANPISERPIISGAEAFLTSLEVTIAAEEGAKIYYTLDGTEPTTSSSQYTGAITLTATTTVKAIAKVDGKDASLVESKTFTKVSTILTIADAKAAIDAGTGVTGVCVEGIISQIDSYNSTYHSITYWISTDGTTTDQFEVYSGRGLNNTDFAAATDLKMGDQVVIYGNIKKYNSTYEFDKENYIVSLIRDETKQEAGLAYETTEYTINVGESFNAPTLTNPNSLAVTYESSNTDLATVDENGAVTLVVGATGTTTITASFAGNDTYLPGSASYTLTVVDPNAPGASAENPYTVAQARAAIDANAGVTGVYATGIVSEIVTAYNSQYGNISYNISADGTTTADQLQAYRGKSYNGDNFTSADDIQVGDVVVICGNLKKHNSTYEFDSGNQLVSLIRKSVINAADVTIDHNATSGAINYTIENPVEGTSLTATSEAEWISNFVVDAAAITFTTTANDGDADRTATITLTYGDVTKEVTVTQEHFEEVLDYAVLPFEWEGGVKADFLALNGVSADGLGSDYAESHEAYRMKFDNTNDCILIKTNERPGVVTIGVKMIGGANASSITVQGSADGETFTDVETLTISGAQNDILTLVTTTDFAENDRYVKLVFTKGSNVGVGPITIAKYSNKQDATITFKKDGEVISTLEVNLNDMVEVAAECNVEGAEITYTSSNPKIATYEDGTILALAEGEATITATFVGNDDYKAATATLEVTVVDNRETVELAFNDVPAEININETATYAATATPAVEGVTYSSSAPTVVSVDEATGAIEALAVGTATITATFAGNDSYKAAEASYTIKVVDPDFVASKYELVTDASTLKADDEIIIVDYEETMGASYAISTIQNTNNRAATSVEVASDGTITPSAEVAIITLGGEAGAWTFYVTNGEKQGYLYAAGGSDKNYLKTQSDPAGATITIAATGEATVAFNGVERNTLRYNPNGTNPPMFSCYKPDYTTNVSLVSIYRKVASTEPEPLKGDVNRDGKQSIADVTALVNIILGKVTEENNPDDYDFKAADVNNDGSRSIADVTALVNIILGKTE